MKSRRSAARHSAFRIPHSEFASRLAFERLEERTVLSSFAVSFGGAGNELTRPIGPTDADESSYLTGSYSSQPVDFDPGPGVANLSSVGGIDAFVAKYLADGAFAWARSFGGPDADGGVRTMFSQEDTGDYVYVAGQFQNAVDFGPGVGVLTSRGVSDLFLLKLDATSGATIWGVQLGSAGTDEPTDVAIDNGKIYIVGSFSGSADFDPGPDATNLSSSNGSSFVWTLDQQGSYVSAWQLSALIASVVADDSAIYLRGGFSGTIDFDPGPGTNTRTSVGSGNLWVARYSLASLDWVSTMQSSQATTGTMAHDASALYVPMSDSYQVSADVLIASYNKQDGSLRWTYRVGTPDFAEFSTTCVINPETGKLYVAGGLSSPVLDFNPSGPGGEVYGQGNSDSFVLKLSAITGQYEQVWHLGGSDSMDRARVHDVRGSKIYVSSSFAGTAVFPSGDTLISQGVSDGYLLVIDETDALPPAPPSTKFYVVDDGTANNNFEYTGGGAVVDNYAINSGNSAPRGAASTAAGDKVWVVDANKKVYVYNTSGGLMGSWSLGSLTGNADVQGITVSGSDVWIVDAKSDKVYRYVGAASRLSGSQNAAGSFNLNSANAAATDLVTDGTSIWVVNNSTIDKVFKYTVSGTLLGSWEITYAGGSPTGITIDPTNVYDIWIVDNTTDRLYQFSGAANRTSGFQNPGTSIPLAAGNTNPQGIADPPVSSMVGIGTPLTRALSDSCYDSALLAVIGEIDDLLTGAKKRK